MLLSDFGSGFESTRVWVRRRFSPPPPPPQGLDRALRIACGTRYLRLATRLRHCKSEPTEKTVALEVAMASHLVRARTLLERWGKALVDIERAHHYRNADQLVSLLKQWRFESTEPQVDGNRQRGRVAQGCLR